MAPAPLNLRYLPSAEKLARYAAEEFLALLICREDRSTPFGVALSGGRIASRFYEQIVDASQQSPASFENVHFFWADERCVPPSDPESNYSIARSRLFEPLKIPAHNVHRIRGEENPSFAAKEAEAEICRILPLDQGTPILDLAVLGMGEDGHTASLFPNEGPEWVDHPAIYRHVRASKPPPDRITLGYAPIIRAAHVWVLVSGAGKAQALEQLFQGKDLPLNRILRRRPVDAKGAVHALILEDFFKPEKRNEG